MAMKKRFQRILACAMSLALAISCVSVSAFAMDDMEEPNPVITEHPDDTMSPTKVVTPIGNKAFYKIDGDAVIYADRDDGTGWTAVPSSYIKGSSYNVGDVDYGMYVVNTTEVRFVALSECHDEGDGTYTFYHGTKDSATVSSDVDTVTNEDPTMGTQFYINIENGIDPDGPDREEVVTGQATADPRVEYDVTVSTKTNYQLNATIPMYVCMYGFRGTGDVVTPTSDAYQMKNYSTINENSKATIVDITKLTHYARIYDENHSDEKLFSIAYDAGTGEYTYWYSNPAFMEDGVTPNPEWTEPAVYLELTDKNINASGEVYVIYIDDAWDFKAAGVLVGDTYRESVTAIDPAHPLAADLVYGEFNFGTEFSVGTAVEGGKTEGLAIKVTELQAQPATWRLVPMSTSSSEMKRGELAMSIAPKSAISDASAIDLSTCSATVDITERGWFLGAPTVDEEGTVTAETILPMVTNAQMAGGNVNAAGCTSVVKVNYTVTPMFSIDDGETGTVSGDAITSNRAA